MSEVFIRCCLGKGDAVWELVDGESVADAEGTWNITLVTSVVFQRWPDVPAVDAVGSHVVSLVRRGVDHDACSWGRQGGARGL